ncbi:MAG: hypothetical protein ITG02_15415 [Patulibacter sp.]|nr:hypothetical protein [Patulibacter sp.]
MSIERAFLVRMTPGEDGVAELIADIGGAQRRIRKAVAGDRVDIIRYEALSSQLEEIARHNLASAGSEAIEIPMVDRTSHAVVDGSSDALTPEAASTAQAWIAAGDVAVEVRTAFGRGPTPPPPTIGTAVAEPARTWDAPPDAQGRQMRGTRAVAERFRQQLKDAVNQVPDAALLPSGVSNRVLTDTLREFVDAQSGPANNVAACDVPVRYRDGSTGIQFPLRSLRLTDQLSQGWRTYRFAMLSIRHTEMDVEVDGAWLRNTDISRPRPAGDTDRIAYDMTRTQLERLCEREPTLIYLYQTGLDTAVVGFYRAVVEHLRRSPQSLAVVPMYFRRQPPGAEARTVAGYAQQSTFEEGKPWAVQTQH